jgi:hypothetical protein
MKDDDGQISSVKVSLKYIPVKMSLEPSESINNMGSLRVDILDAKDLPSADRNGYSDPFCKFELNGETVFKTEVQKKTLHPAWNQYFESQISSRTAAKLECKVYDWDFASDADFLGGTMINLDMLEPFRPKEFSLSLDGKSGTVRVRLLFRPAYVQRSRQGSSTFSGTFATPGKIVTGVAGAPIKGVGLAASGVGRGASFIRNGFKSKKKDDDETNGTAPAEDTPVASTEGFGAPRRATGIGGPEIAPPITPPSTGLSSPHTRTKSSAGSTYTTGGAGAPPNGVANFTVISAAGYPPNSNIMVYVKQLATKKTIHKTKHIKSGSGAVNFDESFATKCSPDTQFQLLVKSHATFGSDDDLGEGHFFVDESGTGQQKVIRAGSGTVTLKSNFVFNEVEDGTPKNGSLRKSFLGKRENGRTSRDGTPS